MKKELFGIFDQLDAFQRHRSVDEFDTVVEGDTITVGIRDPSLSIPNRTTVYDGKEGMCLLWGEVYSSSNETDNIAQWTLQKYREDGSDILQKLNGSYLAIIEYDGEATIYTDPIRSRECFYTDKLDNRIFGTDTVSVASALSQPTVSRQSLIEFAYLSVILEERTLVSEISRIPFDGYITATETGSLIRFVYQPQEFNYTDELAKRLRRALKRRAQLPGPKGLLLGAGYDARVVLSQIPEITHCFTVGTTSIPEVQIAQLLSESYNAEHHCIPLNQGYMTLDFDVIQYTNGLNESIHVHQRGVEQIADVQTMYHGWAFDTLLKDFFIQKSRIGLGNKSIRLSSLAEKPEPVSFLLERRLGVMPESLDLLESCPELEVNDAYDYLHSLLESELNKCRHRCQSEHNVANMFGVKYLPSKSFRRHIDNHFIESFVAADSELIDWHLRTPPTHRSTETYLTALNQLDGNLLQHRPPDRPRSIRIWNPIEGFLRRKLPFLTQFSGSWPNINQLYQQAELDECWFDEYPEFHDQSVRFKLRVHDISIWLAAVLGSDVPPTAVVHPSNEEKL